jgi:signal transduction histidine kinase
MPSRPNRRLRTVALIAVTVAIFAIDAFTRLEMAIAVMYVVVVLLASPDWTRRGVLALSAVCALLTLTAAVIAHGWNPPPSPAGRALVSLTAIAIATWLTLDRHYAIDELQRRQQALRRSEAFLAGAQRLTHTGSFGLRATDGAMVWSEEAARIFAYPPDLTPSMERVLQRTLPEDLAIVRASFDRAFACEGAIDLAHRLLLPDGRIRHVHVLAVASHDDLGHCEYLGAVSDVTARVEAEQQLHATHVQLAHAARVSTLGELAASVAHEVNQPLAAIAANAQAGRRWLARPAPELGEVRAALDGIVQAAERASQVFQRIRALARRTEPVHRPLDLNALLRETVDLLQHELQRRPLDLRVDLDPALPPVSGDAVELQQVLINLVMNALQAGEGGARAPRLELRSVHDSGQVRVSVRDNGPGIPDTDFARLFEPFYSSKPEGMGLGLSICRSIIARHGGRIEARNTPPGSTFAFELPALQETRPHERLGQSAH